MKHPAVPLDKIIAVIFDTDGVITDTAQIHAAAWKTVFDSFLRGWAAGLGEEFRPFDVRADYLRHVDGKSRLDGIRDFLASRDIHLPDDDTAIRGIAQRKDALFLDQIRRYGIAPFPAAVRLIHELRRRGVHTAAVSASRNCAEVLTRAGVAGMFDVRVDGADAVRLGLPGKPDPGLFLEATRRLGIAPDRTAVVEDALAGVTAGRHGGFGLVIGVDRAPAGQRQAAQLLRHGADFVVDDLADLTIIGRVRTLSMS